eukprot:scaffold1163_cov289-Chaetoceros_neogracile.AAC.14
MSATTIDPSSNATTSVRNNKDDGIHIMGIDEEGVEVIVGVRWDNLDIAGDCRGAATKIFPPKSVWQGYDCLVKVAEIFAPFAGFEVNSRGLVIVLNRGIELKVVRYAVHMC